MDEEAEVAKVIAAVERTTRLYRKPLPGTEPRKLYRVADLDAARRQPDADTPTNPAGIPSPFASPKH